jgi:hypothetical protein
LATDGGVVSYGVDDLKHYRQVRREADRPARSASHENPVGHYLEDRQGILNTAKALGLAVAKLLLATGDEVIQ